MHLALAAALAWGCAIGGASAAIDP